MTTNKRVRKQNHYPHQTAIIWGKKTAKKKGKSLLLYNLSVKEEIKTETSEHLEYNSNDNTSSPK